MFTRQDLRNSLTSFKPESTMFLSSVSHDQVRFRSIGVQMTICLCDSCYTISYFPKESHNNFPGIKLLSNHIREYKQQKDQTTVCGSGGMGKFVSPLCLPSRFCNLLAYAINCAYSRGATLLELNLQNLITI